MEPLIKWAGGKRKFVDQILSITGNDFKQYFEPFVGGGALLLNIKASSYFCSDINRELINFHNVVKNHPEELIRELETNYFPHHSKDFYLKIRNIDRDPIEFKKWNSIKKAARFYYLNKTSFNGIWRVNKKGNNNVPFNKIEEKPKIDIEKVNQISEFYKNNNVSFVCAQYKEIIKKAQNGDFVYFDPPYDVEPGQSSFVAYTKSGFNQKNQKELKQTCDTLIKRGVLVAISNSNTDFIRNLYKDNKYVKYEIHSKIISNRTIAASNKARRRVVELLIVGRSK